MAGFLLCIGIEAFDTLIYWSQPIKEIYFNRSINFFIGLKFFEYLQGPLILWYTRALIFSNFTFRKKELLHLIPLVLFPLFLLSIFQTMDSDSLQASVSNYDILYKNVFFRILIFSQDISIMTYAAFSLLYLRKLRLHLHNNYSDTTRIDRNWLRLLVGGFLMVSIWKFFAPIFSLIGFGSAAHIVGLSGNYLDYTLVNLLVFYSIAHSDIVHSVNSEDLREQQEKNYSFDAHDIDQVKDAMINKNLFLQPELTLEQLAESLDLSSRLVSNIINHHFGKSFFEFINFYRVEKAKLLLADNKNNLAMLDVMTEAGFNSKSAFNRFFKKYARMTPTEFRQSAATNKQ